CSGGGFELHPHCIKRNNHRQVLATKRPAAILRTPASHTSWAGVSLLRLHFSQFSFFPVLLTHIFGEHSDDGERLAVDVYDFTEWHNFPSGLFRRTKKFIANPRADHAHTPGI